MDHRGLFCRARLMLACGSLWLVLPAFAQAQWATTSVEHNWTVQVGEQRFGLEQTLTLPGSLRQTNIHVGRASVQSKLPAGSIVALVIAPVVMLLVAVAVSVPRMSGRPRLVRRAR